MLVNQAHEQKGLHQLGYMQYQESITRKEEQGWSTHSSCRHLTFPTTVVLPILSILDYMYMYIGLVWNANSTHQQLFLQIVYDLPHVCAVVIHVVCYQPSSLTKTSYHTSVLRATSMKG